MQIKYIDIRAWRRAKSRKARQYDGKQFEKKNRRLITEQCPMSKRKDANKKAINANYVKGNLR
jgi:hypothetical protein